MVHRNRWFTRSFFRMVDLSMANCLFVITRGLTWGVHPVVMVGLDGKPQVLQLVLVLLLLGL